MYLSWKEGGLNLKGGFIEVFYLIEINNDIVFNIPINL